MRTKAIIIKKQMTKEYDQLITCYSQERGKLTAIAKSSLKESSIQGMHLDVLNLVDFDLINGRATPIITGAQSENTFGHIRKSLAHQAVAYFFFEVIDRVAYDNQKDEKLWNFLRGLLIELDAADASALMPFFRKKQADFLSVLGYASQLPAIPPATFPSSLDTIYECTFGLRLNSLRFLYEVM